MSLSNDLYKIARMFGKASSRVRDIEVLATGNPAKIAKRAGRKAAYKYAGKTINRLFK